MLSSIDGVGEDDRMINLDHIKSFCDTLYRRFKIGFRQVPTPYGFQVLGEYLNKHGQVMYLVLDVYSKRVDVQIFDAMRRPVFAISTRGNINNNSNIFSFIQRSISGD